MTNLEKYKDAWGGSAWTDEKWVVRLASNGWKDYICPECDYIENIDINCWIGWAYCPKCGAKLRDHYITSKEYSENLEKILKKMGS